MSLIDGLEITEAKLTAAHAYDWWSTVAFYGYDSAYIEYDKEEALANSIGWANRNQEEILN